MNKQCNFHESRGTTYGSDAIHRTCGCAVLRTDRDMHEDGECRSTTYCYFYHNIPEQSCERMLERVDGKYKHCDEGAVRGTLFC